MIRRLVQFEDKTNFLEYGSFCIVIREYLGHKDLPFYNPIDPADSYLNILLSLDQKGVANIYKIMLGKNRNILTETSDKWNEKINLNITTFTVGRSFNKISIIDDIYLRYIQFRTLHRTFYTNNILHKIGIKDSEICSLCNRENDSNEHMLILCDVSNALWSSGESRIRGIGIDEYSISNDNFFWRGGGELDGSYWVKECIFMSKIRETKPSLSQAKANVTFMHNYEKLSFQMKDKEGIFIRRFTQINWTTENNLLYILYYSFLYITHLYRIYIPVFNTKYCL